MELLGNIFTGLGTFAGVRSSNRSARRINQQNIDAQNRINDLNYQRQLEFFNRVNEYNSPKAVMQRYEDAGINPHLVASHIYGGSASSPVYRAEAGFARNSLSNANPMSHVLNTLGNILHSVYLSHLEDEKINRAERKSDIMWKNVATFNKLATLHATDRALDEFILKNKSNKEPSSLTWRQFFSNIRNGLANPQSYVNGWNRVLDSFLTSARPSYTRTKTTDHRNREKVVNRIRFF